MRAILLTLLLSVSANLFATKHIIQVWNGYFQFLPSTVTIELGDTLQWLPLDQPTMTHTITSDNIPVGAASFNYTWMAPADTFYQYIPTVVGTYNYVCTPHVSIGMIASFEVTSTNVDVGEVSKEFSISPNPASGILNLAGINSNETFKIFSLNGSVILEGKLKEEITIEHLTSGTYLLRIYGDTPKSIKFIKE